MENKIPWAPKDSGPQIRDYVPRGPGVGPLAGFAGWPLTSARGHRGPAPAEGPRHQQKALRHSRCPPGRRRAGSGCQVTRPHPPAKASPRGNLSGSSWKSSVGNQAAEQGKQSSRNRRKHWGMQMKACIVLRQNGGGSPVSGRLRGSRWHPLYSPDRLRRRLSSRIQLRGRSQVFSRPPQNLVI